MGTQPPEPGWYPISDRPGVLGYWDGTRWTGHEAPVPGSQAVASASSKKTFGTIGVVALALIVGLGLTAVVGVVVAASGGTAEHSAAGHQSSNPEASPPFSMDTLFVMMEWADDEGAPAGIEDWGPRTPRCVVLEEWARLWGITTSVADMGPDSPFGRAWLHYVETYWPAGQANQLANEVYAAVEQGC